MKRINHAILRKGDIVLTTQNEWVSGKIRKFTKSDISHAMLCVASSSIIDSTLDGVHSHNPQKMFYDETCAIHILRLRKTLTSSEADGVVTYVRSIIATPYSRLEAGRSLFPVKSQGSRKQFCSRLVAQAYHSIGINLVENPNFCTPEDLKKSELLQLIHPAFIEVDEQEILSIQSEGDETLKMREITNKLISEAKKFAPDILSVNDIDELLITRPELDSAFANAYKSSGYLNFWKTEEEKYPWRYDISEMSKMINSIENDGKREALIEYCQNTLIDADNNGFQHWYDNLNKMHHLYSRFHFQTYALLLELYENLVKQNQKRNFVARMMLSLLR